MQDSKKLSLVAAKKDGDKSIPPKYGAELPEGDEEKTEDDDDVFGLDSGEETESNAAKEILDERTPATKVSPRGGESLLVDLAVFFVITVFFAIVVLFLTVFLFKG